MNEASDAVARDLFNEAGIAIDLPDTHSLHCPQLNISQCPVFEDFDQLTMIVYNPIASNNKTHLIRLPILDGQASWKQSDQIPLNFELIHSQNVIVSDASGTVLHTTIQPLRPEVFGIQGRTSTAQNEILIPVQLPDYGKYIFKAKKVPS